VTDRDHLAAADPTQPRNGTPAQGSVRGECTEREPCPYVTGTVTRYCTLTPFTLTDAEREAIADAADRYASVTPESAETAATLRGLLERMGAANSGEDRRSEGGE